MATKSRTRRASASKAKPAGKTTVTKKVRTTEVEVADEEGGPGWETGVAILTGVLLLMAILIVDFNLGKNYDAGVFF
jgi:hypothetical protein